MKKFTLFIAAALAAVSLLALSSLAAAQCTCTGGTDAWGNPVDPDLVDCGTTVCGADQTMYACTASGWSQVPGSVCNDPTVTAATIYVADCVGDGSGTSADPYCDLQDAIDAAADGDIIEIANGTYNGRAEPFIDPTCGNCEPGLFDPSGNPCWPFRQNISVTWGFHVFGKSLTLRGASRTGTKLHTGANYGLLFQYAGNSRVENLTVTGGVRSPWIEATDAAIIARYTNLTIDGVDVRDNTGLYSYPGRPSCRAGVIEMGVAGIVGREGTALTVQNNNILGNSWDGITLFQSDPAVGLAASATIRDNVIGDGVNPGAGDGIGVTHDASGLIVRNIVRGTYKGIGAFGESQVTLRNNILHSLKWWALHSGENARMNAYNNVVDLSGLATRGIWSNSPTSEFFNNIVSGDSGDNGLFATQGSFRYNNVTTAVGGNLFAGTDGNLEEDPGFTDAADHDYTLLCDSTMIDAGDPDFHFNDLDGTRNDIGAYGGPASPGGAPAACCTCTGGTDYWGNSIDPATTYCGMTVCGQDDQYYDCTSGGWSAIGGSPCSTTGCVCTDGTDYWGNPVDPATTYCGMTVCGQDNQYYQCTSSGWNAIGGSPCASTGSCTCTGGSDYWGNPVDPATTYCGMTVCGGDNQYYECTASGWNAIGGSPCAPTGGCTCTGGSDYWGNSIDPATTFCGMQVCGGDNQYYECTASGWSAIGGYPCAGGGGGSPSGRITAHCGFGVPLPYGHTAWSPAGPCEGVCYSGWTDGHCSDPADAGSRIDVYGCTGKTSGSGYSCDGNHNGGVLIGTFSNSQQVRFSDFWNTSWCTLQIDVLRPSAGDPIGLRDFLVWERDSCP